MLGQGSQDMNKQKKLRTACDICHQAKMKCSGGNPCSGCGESGYECFYSLSNRIGRPKGTKNKRTLERMTREQDHEELEKASNKAQDNGVRVRNPITQPGFINFDGHTNTASCTVDNTLVDSPVGSTVSYPPLNATIFDPSMENLDAWYDWGSAGLSNMNVCDGRL